MYCHGETRNRPPSPPRKKRKAPSKKRKVASKKPKVASKKPKVSTQKQKSSSMTSSSCSFSVQDLEAEFQSPSEVWLFRLASVFGWDYLDSENSENGGPHVRRRITNIFRVTSLFDGNLPDFRRAYHSRPFILPGLIKTNGNKGGWYSTSTKAARVWNELNREEIVKMVNARYDRLDGKRSRRSCRGKKAGGAGEDCADSATALRRIDVDGHDFDICNLPEIYNGLFLGNAEVASNPELIRKLKIDAILNVTDSDQYFNHCNNVEAVAAAESGETQGSIVSHYEKISIEDTFDTKLFESHLGSAMAFLDRCLLTGTRVLVHCRAGKSRSVTIVMAWAIGRFGMKLSTLLPLLAARRKGLNVNLGFADKIMKMEKAMLGVASVARGGQHRRSNMGKFAMLFNSGSGAK